MIITHHGLSCIKMSIKTASGKEHTLIADPFDSKATGVKLSKQKADVVVVSQPDSNAHNNTDAVVPAEEAVFVINEPGEYEVRDIFVQGVVAEPGVYAYVLEAERVKIGFLGGVSASPISDNVIEAFEDVDILCVPVGGKTVLDAKKAAQVVRQIEPRMVVPMYYAVPGCKEKLDTVEAFKKELGTKHIDELDKLKVTKKDLPQEDMQLVILKV